MESNFLDSNKIELKNSHSSFFVSNFMFMMLAFAFIGLSLLMQFIGVGFKASILIIQYGIIGIPIFISMKLTKVDIKKAFRFNKIPFKTIYKIVLITLASLPIAYFLNLVLNVILMKLDLFQIQTMDIGTGTLNFFVMFFLISITPGICEEIFFRGMMFSGYSSKMKPSSAIVLTGVLFGLFHFNLQNLMLPIFLGIILALVVYITDSIYSSMIAHGLFNGIGLLIMYFIPSSGSVGTTPTDVEASVELIEQAAPAILGFLFVVSLLCGGVLYLLINMLKKDYVKISVDDQLVIKEQTLVVVGFEDDIIIVENELKELKKLKSESLKDLSYKLVKVKKRIEYDKASPWNIVFVGSVVLLYLGFTFYIYS